LIGIQLPVKYKENFMFKIRAAERLAGAQGKYFFRGPYFKKIFRKIFFPETTSPPGMGILPKKTNILPFA
jgi:hypothetical protein